MNDDALCSAVRATDAAPVSELSVSGLKSLFEAARQIREVEIMQLCLRRLVETADAAGDVAGARRYRLLRSLLPAARAQDAPDHPVSSAVVVAESGPRIKGSSASLPASLPAASGEAAYPGVPASVVAPVAGAPLRIAEPEIDDWERLESSLESSSGATFPDATPGLSERIAVAVAEGRLPAALLRRGPIAFAARCPLVTLAEICQFSDGRQGVLVILPDSGAGPGPSGLTLVFDGGYRGAAGNDDGFAGDGFAGGGATSDPTYWISLWHMGETPAWAMFFDATSGFLKSFFPAAMGPDRLPSSIAQLLFYRLTDLETMRGKA